MPLLVLALSLATLLQGKDTPAAPPVKVSVYYESLCGDSARFFTQQLYPVWKDLKDIIELDVNSYGKSTNTPDGDGYKFQCQHGPRECKGNMMLTCAKKHVSNQDKFMAFSNCVMKQLRGAEAGDQCAREVGVDFCPIKECLKSIEGQRLQHEVGVKQAALHPTLYYVPWILINDGFSRSQLSRAQANLREVVCQAYTGVPPAQCHLQDL